MSFKKCYGLQIAMAKIIHFWKLLSIFACSLYRTFSSLPKVSEVSESIQKGTNVQHNVQHRQQH
jgi:hypothetical protein